MLKDNPQIYWLRSLVVFIHTNTESISYLSVLAEMTTKKWTSHSFSVINVSPTSFLLKKLAQPYTSHLATKRVHLLKELNCTWTSGWWIPFWYFPLFLVRIEWFIDWPNFWIKVVSIPTYNCLMTVVFSPIPFYLWLSLTTSSHDSLIKKYTINVQH